MPTLDPQDPQIGQKYAELKERARIKAEEAAEKLKAAAQTKEVKIDNPAGAPNATPKKGNRLIRYGLIFGVIGLLLLLATQLFGGGGTPSTPTPNSALPLGFGSTPTIDPFAFPSTTPTPLGSAGFGTQTVPTTNMVGKRATIHYGQGTRPSDPNNPFADPSTYLDKHPGSPNAALNPSDPGFINGTLGIIQQVQANAKEESGRPYSYDNGNPNNGDASCACLFQPIDPVSGLPATNASGQPIAAAWVACGGLNIQP